MIGQQDSILFMDNNSRFLKTRARFLRRAGYRPILVHSPEEAVQQLQTQFIRLMLLDVRARNDEDKYDFSGIEFAKQPQYRSIPKIMLTHFEDIEAVLAALLPSGTHKQPPVAGYVLKQDGPDKMLDEIKTVLRRVAPNNPTLDIEFGEMQSLLGLLSHIDQSLPRHLIGERLSELESLLEKLFESLTQVRVTQLLNKSNGCVQFAVSTHNAHGREQQYVVFCGTREAAQKDADNHHKFIPQFNGIGSAVQQMSHFTLRYGATAYALIGAQPDAVRTLAARYGEISAETLCQMLDHLLTRTLPSWQQQREYAEYSLPALFSAETWPTKLPTIINALCDQILFAGINGVTIQQHSKIRLVGELQTTKLFDLPHQTVKQLANQAMKTLLVSTTHGNLAPNTILSDANAQAWPIDFRHVRHAPLLYELVRLECSLKCKLLGMMPVARRYTLEQALLDTTRLDDPLSTTQIDAELSKMLHAIERIRQRAAAMTLTDLETYHQCLLWCTIGRLLTFNPQQRYTRQKLHPYLHALISITMLSEHLTQSNRIESVSLPTTSNESLRIKGKRVWVEGKEREITGIPFKLLSYLYKHPNQVCSRQEIAENVLNDTWNVKLPYLNTYAINRMNTNVRRIRRVIEPDPANPRYLITYRGKGYLLKVENRHADKAEIVATTRLTQ